MKFYFVHLLKWVTLIANLYGYDRSVYLGLLACTLEVRVDNKHRFNLIYLIVFALFNDSILFQYHILLELLYDWARFIE
jgi:hypothetical protein